MALFFSGQCRRRKIQVESDVKAMNIKSNGRGWFPLTGHNFLLVYYRFDCKGNFYKYALYDTWVQMLLQIGPLLRLSSKGYYGWDFYCAWVQMLL